MPSSTSPCMVRVDYEWKPTRCQQCKTFGHSCLNQEHRMEQDRDPLTLPYLAAPRTPQTPQTTYFQKQTSKQQPSQSKPIAHNGQPDPGTNKEPLVTPAPNQRKKPHNQTHLPRARTLLTKQLETKPITDTGSSQAGMTTTTAGHKAWEEATRSDEGGQTVGKITANPIVQSIDSSQSRVLDRRGDDLTETASSSKLLISDDDPPHPSTIRKKGGKKKKGGWDYTSNVREDLPCRILVSWNSRKIEVNRICKADQWITCDIIKKHTRDQYTVTFVYAYNTPSQRARLWEYIAAPCPWKASKAWIVMGDFNAALRPEDRFGGDRRWLSHHEEFRECMNHANLIQLPYSEVRPTWHNNQQGGDEIFKEVGLDIREQSAMNQWPQAHGHFSTRDPIGQRALCDFL
ncbi:hypothetical protein OIU85_010716 [Salix viminalis]|uniref:Endonuclease/exonuclease/phosphatase domain-containing protein n=1 Tax=Salix viminalis TaxID=40686 RepID=A0A9Q0SEV1_SALVM|nr:hypothetical protein OIU85_010716 [Salix viminalis]